MDVENPPADFKKRKLPNNNNNNNNNNTTQPQPTTQPLQPMALASTRLALQPLPSLRPSISQPVNAGNGVAGGGVPSRNLFMSFLLQGANAMSKPKLKA